MEWRNGEARSAGRERVTLIIMSEWRVRRGNEEWPTKGIEELQDWAKSGNVRPEDYVWNPILQKWLYAKDVAELEGFLPDLEKVRATDQATRAAIGVAVAGLVLCFIFPPLGSLLFIAGVVLAVVSYTKQ